MPDCSNDMIRLHGLLDNMGEKCSKNVIKKGCPAHFIFERPRLNVTTFPATGFQTQNHAQILRRGKTVGQ
jgi:hypothetical protein